MLALSVLSDARRSPGQDADRLRALGELAVAAQGGRPMDEVARAIARLAVGRVADLCLIDVVGEDGRLRRLGAALAGSGQPPALPDPPPVPATALPAATLHVPRLPGTGEAGLPYAPSELQALRSAGVAAIVVIPLISREHAFGRLLLGTRDFRRGLSRRADVEYAETFAGRAALALENAVLSSELSTTERQLEVILNTIDAAITVRAVDGRMVYANQAAADLLRLPDAETVKAHPPGKIMDLFDVYNEAGDPIDLAQLPGTRMLAGEPEPEALLVRNVVRATGEERWLLNKANAVTGPDGRVLMAVNLIEDVTETKRAELGQRLLAAAARQVAEADDPTEAFEAIARAAVPGLADWAGVDVLDESGRIVTVAIAHRDPDKVRLGWRLRRGWPVEPDEEGGIAAVIRTGEPELITEVSDELLVLGARDAEHLEVMRSVGMNSAMVTPIRAGDRVLGALSYVSSTSRRFDDRDLELASDLGRQIGIMLANAQLHAEQAEIARTLQAGLIPQSLPKLEGWQISSAYRAAGRANEVGGDFYDVVRYPGGWAAIIGDVIGKGAEAASLTALARHTADAIIESTGDVAHALRVLNRRLRERGDDFRSLCTLAVLAVPDTGSPMVYSAGHPLPLLSRQGSVIEVGEASPMLGFVDDLEVACTRVEIGPGDQIVLYTDGVLDAVGFEGRFGERGLADAVQAAETQNRDTAAEVIMAAIEGFLSGEQSDDIAILSLTRAGVAAAAT